MTHLTPFLQDTYQRNISTLFSQVFSETRQYTVQTPGRLFTSRAEARQERICHISWSDIQYDMPPIMRILVLGVQGAHFYRDEIIQRILSKPLIQNSLRCRQLIVIHDSGASPEFLIQRLHALTDAACPEGGVWHVIGSSLGCGEAIHILSARNDREAFFDTISPVTGLPSSRRIAFLEDQLVTTFQAGSLEEKALLLRRYERLMMLRSLRYEPVLAGVPVRIHATPEDEVYTPEKALRDLSMFTGNSATVTYIKYNAGSKLPAYPFVHYIDPDSLINGQEHRDVGLYDFLQNPRFKQDFAHQMDSVL